MEDRTERGARSRLARSAGALYLIIIVLGLFSELYVRSGLIVRGDAVETFRRIVAEAWLFRLGFASDLVVFLCDVAIAVLLYALFRPVSRTAALLATGFQLVGTAIYSANLLNYFAALLLATGSEYANGLTSSQVQSLVLFLLDVHKHGYDLGLVFFGVHCLMLGYLIYRSDFLPRTLGVLMVLAFLGYLVGSLTLFVFPAHVQAVMPVYLAPLIGEVALCLWLLIKGVRVS